MAAGGGSGMTAITDLADSIKNSVLELAEENASLRAEIKRLREALSCSAENCSEFGRYHDGDCSECPQSVIRRRAGMNNEPKEEGNER